MDEMKDFADEINKIGMSLKLEEQTRKNDDQDIIDVLNDVCFKMSLKFKN